MYFYIVLVNFVNFKTRFDKKIMSATYVRVAKTGPSKTTHVIAIYGKRRDEFTPLPVCGMRTLFLCCET